MKKTVFALRACLLLVLIAFAGSCAEKNLRPPAPPEMPGWCVKPSGALADDARGKLLVGIGSVAGIKSPAMARTNADGQARGEVARLFGLYVDALLKHYQDAGLARNQEELLEAGRVFAKMNVRSAAIEDRYMDQQSGTWYSKAVAPLEQFLLLIQENAELSDALRRFAAEKQEDLFSLLPRHDDAGAVNR